MDGVLAVCFRHRSSLLALLAWPLVVAGLHGSRTGVRELAWGSGLVVAGVVLRLCAVRQIGRRARVGQPPARSGLRDAGPYAFTRNPLYLAAGLVLTGLVVILGGGWYAPSMLVATVAVYTPVVLYEERELRKLLGAPYAEYLRRVPRWLGARATRAGSPAAAEPVSWREVLHREPLLVPGALAAVLAAAVFSRWFGGAADPPGVEGLPMDPALVVGAGLASYLVVNSWSIERKRRRRDALGSGRGG